MYKRGRPRYNDWQLRIVCTYTVCMCFDTSESSLRRPNWRTALGDFSLAWLDWAICRFNCQSTYSSWNTQTQPVLNALHIFSEIQKNTKTVCLLQEILYADFCICVYWFFFLIQFLLFHFHYWFISKTHKHTDLLLPERQFIEYKFGL